MLETKADCTHVYNSLWKDKWVEVSEVYQSWLDGFGGQNVSMKYYYAITDRRVL